MNPKSAARSLRALLISDVYFPRVNGVSTSVATFRRDLNDLGVETWLVAPEYPQKWTDDDRVRRQASRYLFFDPEDRLMKTRTAERACIDLAKRADVLHIQTPFVAHVLGRRVARVVGLPTVETYHTYFQEYLHHYLPIVPSSLARTIARTVSRAQCNAVDAVVAPSRQLADVLVEYGVTSPISVIPTGLKLDQFAPGDGAAFRMRHGITPHRPMMLLVGRVAHEKNIGFLLEVLGEVRKRVPDVVFAIAGEGPALSSVRGRAQSLGLESSTLFVGYLDRERELRDCYSAADVFVFASRTETQGLVLLESLALGLPVVSTAVLGTKEVLAGADGALVVPEELGPFADAVVRVLTDAALRGSLRAAGRAFVAEHWSSVEMARRMHNLYASLARNRR
jgi:1,2-diacylglycerol 3-alpha-glucosyltransferase